MCIWQEPIKFAVFNTLGGGVVSYKDLIVGEQLSACLHGERVSEVLNAKQTRFIKIYSDMYRGT